jgi:hypothetical protein
MNSSLYSLTASGLVRIDPSAAGLTQIWPPEQDNTPWNLYSAGFGNGRYYMLGCDHLNLYCINTHTSNPTLEYIPLWTKDTSVDQNLSELCFWPSTGLLYGFNQSTTLRTRAPQFVSVNPWSGGGDRPYGDDGDG